MIGARLNFYINEYWSPERTIDIIRIIGNSGTYGIYRAAH
jgi:hypothetical protein